METIRSLRSHYEVVGIAEPDPALRSSAVQDTAYQGLRWRSTEDLLSDPSIEVIVIETRLEDAPRFALSAIKAGKSIHLDKPGSDSHQRFREMRQLAESRDRVVQMGYMLRYNPGVQLLMRAHREGWLGRITEIDASMGKLAGDEAQQALVGYPGHGMFELACHLVDVVVALLGKPDRVQAFSRKTGLSIGSLEDNQLAILEYPSVVVTLRCNHADPFGNPHRRIQVVGTRGSLLLQPLESGRGLLQVTDAFGEFQRGDNPLALSIPTGRYAGEFLDLAKAIRSKRSLGWSADHDIAVHAAALRCAGVEP
jgi:predicted dehydrogenase